jgi:hypothetical protein
MGLVRTHGFRHGRYHITETERGLDGCCDVPDDPNDTRLDMHILAGNTRRALNTALHEMMHAEGIDSDYVHDGSPDRIAACLWRMGWRRLP